jgi:K+-sensing histidine kinase KdpD
MTSLVRRYGMAVVSVSIATGLGFLSKRFTPRDVEFAVFLFAVAITVWYAGAGPGALAIVLSGLSVAYFLTEPLYSLYIEPTDIPYFIIIAAFALLIAGFSSIRRRIEQGLGKPAINSRSKWRNELDRRACSISRMTPFLSVI